MSVTYKFGGIEYDQADMEIAQRAACAIVPLYGTGDHGEQEAAKAGKLWNDHPAVQGALRALHEGRHRLASASAPAGWRAMESAPTDGTRFLASTPWGVEMVKWHPGTPGGSLGEGWIGTEQDSTCLPERRQTGVPQCQPTQWMPLPSLTAAPQPPVGDSENNPLTARLLGRARFLRDRGEIKTPALLEQAAAALATQPADERMREACAKLADDLASECILSAEGSEFEDHRRDWLARSWGAATLVRRIRALPLTKEPRDDR